VEELERLLEIAKDNFRQFGGELPEDRRKLKEEKEKERWDKVHERFHVVCVFLPNRLRDHLCLGTTLFVVILKNFSISWGNQDSKQILNQVFCFVDALPAK